MQDDIFESLELLFLKGKQPPILSCSNYNSFQAIKCSFAKYDPKEKRWNEGIASFSSQLMGKHCSVTVVDILQEEMMLNFAVDVLLDFGKYLVV